MTSARGDAFRRLSRLVLEDGALTGLLVDRRYEVSRRLAAGGMGEVFQAHDTRLDRPVAMKLVGAAHPGWVARFRLEMRTLTRLDHPGIVPIYDLGTLADGRLYYTMKYVEGQTLRDLTGAALERRVALLVRTCDIVQFAHDRGVVHRDLKPSNIMADGRDNVFVLDWGVAHVRDAGTAAAAGNAVIGTLGYLPPEQARGERAGVDARSDIFSLGAILYEFLTGQPPVTGVSRADRILRTTAGTVKPPRSLRPGIPPELEAICLKALEREPSRRYASARALGEDLRCWLEGRPVRAYSDGWGYRLRTFVRRRRAAVLAAVVAAQVSVLAVALGILLPRAEHRRAREERRRMQADLGARERSKPAFERGRIELEEAVKDLYRHGADLVRTRARLERAVDAFTDSLAEWPENADALVGRGRARALRFEIREAIADFTRALEVSPACAAARAERGRLHLQQYVEARFHRGWVWDERAAAPYESWKALARADLVDDAYVAFAEGNLTACLDGCARRLRERPEQEELWKLQGDAAYFAVGMAEFRGERRGLEKLDAAIRCYTEAIRLRPNYYEARLMRGNAYLQRGEAGRAIEDIGVAHRLRPDDALACWFMGQVSTTYEDALEWYERGLCIQPESFLCRMNRALTLGVLDRLPEARAEVDRSVGLNPGHYYGWYLRGCLRAKQNDFQGAFDDLRKGTELAPDFSTAWYNLGVVARRLGRPQEAVRALERALALHHPGREKVEEELALARRDAGR